MQLKHGRVWRRFPGNIWDGDDLTELTKEEIEYLLAKCGDCAILYEENEECMSEEDRLGFGEMLQRALEARK